MTLEREAERAVVGDAAHHGVGLLRADDLVFLLLVLLNVKHLDGAADDDDALFDLGLFDDDGVFDQVLHFGDAGVELALLGFRLVILAVFGEVAEGARFLDQLRDFLFAGGLEIVQLVFERVEALLAHFVTVFSVGHVGFLLPCMITLFQNFQCFLELEIELAVLGACLRLHIGREPSLLGEIDAVRREIARA